MTDETDPATDRDGNEGEGPRAGGENGPGAGENADAPDGDGGASAGGESADPPDGSPDSGPTNGRGSTGEDGSRADDGSGAADGGESALDPADVVDVFTVLDAAVDALEGEQLDRVLAVLEAAIARGSGADPETVAELVEMLEELVVEPDAVDEEELESALSATEEVLEVTDQPAGDPVSVVEEGLGPATGLGDAIADLAEAGGFGELFPFLGGGPDGRDRDGGGATSEADLFRIARIAAATTRQATGTSAESGVRTGTRMAHAAANSRSPAELVTRTRTIALEELGRAGVDVGEVNESWLEAGGESDRPLTRAQLQERGRQLLSESAQVGRGDSPHPSFPSVLDQLRPDEGRILRLLATEGPQPRIEVRDRGYFPLTTSTVADSLTMLGSDAGCRRPDRVPAYLDNLQRLGLVTFSERPVEDLQQYRILEAEPHVEAAHDRATWPTAEYVSVRLTDLGVEFCETCFPFEVVADSPNAWLYEGENGGGRNADGRDP